MITPPSAARNAALEAIFAHLSAPPEEADALAAIRRGAEVYSMGQRGPGLNACRAVETIVGGRPALWLVPPDSRKDVRLLHLHGGGWVAGSIESHRAFAAELAWLARAPVLLPAYRLAPEHPYPAGLEDALSALDHARKYGPDGAAAPASVGVSGDSAGGNLAAAVALNCASQGRAGPDRIVLMSPFLALKLGTGAWRAWVRDPVVQQEGIDFVAAMYAGNRSEPDPFIEPLLGDDSTLGLLAPVLIQASAAENLREQALAFANRLWEVGVEARLTLWPGVPHVWHLFLETLPDARTAMAEAAAFLSPP